VRIGIGVNKRRGSEKNGIGIKITGIAHFSSIVGNKILNCRLSETILSVMVTIGMIGQISDSRTMIDVLMGRSGGECQFMIGWGAGLVCMTGLVNVLVIFQGSKRNLKRWQMRGFPMNSYSTEMLILIGWSQEKLTISQYGRQNFLNGVQKD